jgi:hypothetical protein
MASQGQLQATAQDNAGEGRHHGLRTDFNGRDDIAQHGRFKLRRCAELGHIGAGRKGFVGSDEHDGCHLRVGFGAADRFNNVLAQCKAQAVDGRGVEFNTRYTVSDR